MTTRVYLGSDHAGFALKARLIEHLPSVGYEPVDCGPPDYRDGDDYPPYCLLVGQKVVVDVGSFGIVIGGSGNGEAIAANKVKGVRCALAFSDDTARLGREHNNANVLSLGSRMYDEDTAVRFAELFLAEPFSEAERHVRRINLLTRYEETGELPPRREDLA
ncbi:MAG: ribose-5-phosphate isomerase [Frankiaceae bacterium]|nr:ribose-5-phosphate isomerase [Frankiaceae bacterium]MBV9869853.1 ribose-5-phosphate isomerase [Frankiaceae bacterium]